MEKSEPKPKLCVNCEHHYQREHSNDHYCKLYLDGKGFQYTDLVTGASAIPNIAKFPNAYCHKQRADEPEYYNVLCGVEGKYFEPKK